MSNTVVEVLWAVSKHVVTRLSGLIHSLLQTPTQSSDEKRLSNMQICVGFTGKAGAAVSSSGAFVVFRVENEKSHAIILDYGGTIESWLREEMSAAPSPKSWQEIDGTIFQARTERKR